MKVLAIGNSFSRDATRYLKAAANALGDTMKVVNLYIGGCSLKKHYLNALENNKAYALDFGGETTGFLVSIKDALMSDDWDVVTLQQASHLSTDYATYQPYLGYLTGYIQTYCPGAKFVLHQTWPYEAGSERLGSLMGYHEPSEMLRDLDNAYKKAAQISKPWKVIPSGDVMFTLSQKLPGTVYRDTYHASKGLGRYALALTWYAALTEKSILSIPSFPLDVPVAEDQLSVARECVETIVFKRT